jgi:hypothetical protein
VSEKPYHCETCSKDSVITAEHTCKHCGSEDIFDKRLPEWPCKRCNEYTALYKSVCVECQKELFGVALSVLLLGDDDIDRDDLNHLLHPREDYGDAEHRVFNGVFWNNT